MSHYEAKAPESTELGLSMLSVIFLCWKLKVCTGLGI